MIDHATVQKILDAADIVEVVSDYVSLKRRGANYIGLCPFHNERTPSFSVSPSKGICRCFSCGKGGSAVGFIMELEQKTYPEALRQLAAKYHIEIQERELSDEEREQSSRRESMLAINEFALNHFEHLMMDTEEGRDVGLSYFRHRGISDAMIKRFRLGYAIDKTNELSTAARSKGFNPAFLVDTGLCYENDRHQLIDRFRGRVIYPVFTVSGRVVAFGGRILSSEKSPAKYVNSPESIIYKKSRELYGLYQAKQAIAKRDQCILVEGYMDVISMHQRGVENVVASSGTSLTEEQIVLIRRWTRNVTVIYDADAAGLKAALRGIDMLLVKEMSVRVLLLPPGEDPDSFAQSHTSDEVEEYIASHSEDFISFKTRVLLKDAGNDPIRRATVINDIVNSISLIPDPVQRAVYVSEMSRAMKIDEKSLMLKVRSSYAANIEKQSMQDQRRRNRIEAGLPAEDEPAEAPAEQPVTDTPDASAAISPAADTQAPTSPHAQYLRPYELDILRYVLRYGVMYLGDFINPDNPQDITPMSVIDYVISEFRIDDMHFSNPDIEATFMAAIELSRTSWSTDYTAYENEARARQAGEFEQGIAAIRAKADDFTAIETAEKQLRERLDAELASSLDQYAMRYIAERMISSPDKSVMQLTFDLVSDKHHLSKIHTRFAKIVEENERLIDLLPLAVFNLKSALIECRVADLRNTLTQSEPADQDQLFSILNEIKSLNEKKMDLAKFLGDRITSNPIR